MKRFRLPLLIASFAAAVFSASPSQAAISITNFTLTPNSVSFEISGTMPSPLPGAYTESFFFVNPNPAAAPGFSLPVGFEFPTSLTYSGSPSLYPGLEIWTGDSTAGDYFGMYFELPLIPGDVISGALTATWANIAFDPGAVTSLNVYWGVADSFTLTSGTFLTSVSVLAAVPEPSTTTLLGAAGLSLGLIRRRRA